MKLEEAAAWLFARRSHGVRWGLERTVELLAGVDDPHRRFHSILIGGSNGKGSVAAFCESVLRAAAPDPATIGMYSSPHLVDFRERVRIGGALVDEQLFLDSLQRLRPLIERTGATFFEATTAAAFLCFAEAGVHAAVVEVGLGGRLDATNTLEPVLSVVTNIALEHTEYLGSTLAEIAREKAGIFRERVPAITAEPDQRVSEVLQGEADARGTRLHHLRDWVSQLTVEAETGGSRVRYRSEAWGELDLLVPLHGAHQATNAMLAAEALGLLEEALRPNRDALRRGVAGTRWPGRLQVVTVRGTTWLLDVAHNPAGVRSLVEALAAMALPEPRVALVGILADKATGEMLEAISPVVRAMVLTIPPTAPSDRRWNPEAAAADIHGIPVRVIPDFAAALQRAETMAPHGTVLVTGSLHTVGDAMALLGIAPF